MPIEAPDAAMTEARDLHSFHRPGALHDGTPITIRTARADDRGRLVSAFSGLDRETIYTRFHGFRKEVSPVMLTHLEAGDFDRFVGLVATLGTAPDEIVIGAATYVVLDPTPDGRAADIAFVVEEDYQGQGVAGSLLATAIDVARERGIVRFEADVLAGNVAMLAVFRRCGLPLATSREGGAIHVALELTAGAAPR